MGCCASKDIFTPGQTAAFAKAGGLGTNQTNAQGISVKQKAAVSEGTADFVPKPEPAAAAQHCSLGAPVGQWGLNAA